jgi:late competence protein required for DNA uptake (superfamily II DNA/RNA helicase)
VLTVAIGFGAESVEGCAKTTDIEACPSQKAQANALNNPMPFIDLPLRYSQSPYVIPHVLAIHGQILSARDSC